MLNLGNNWIVAATAMATLVTNDPLVLCPVNDWTHGLGENMLRQWEGGGTMHIGLPAMRGAQSSAHRFLHERADPCLAGGGQLLQREGGPAQGMETR